VGEYVCVCVCGDWRVAALDVESNVLLFMVYCMYDSEQVYCGYPCDMYDGGRGKSPGDYTDAPKSAMKIRLNSCWRMSEIQRDSTRVFRDTFALDWLSIKRSMLVEQSGRASVVGEVFSPRAAYFRTWHMVLTHH